MSFSNLLQEVTSRERPSSPHLTTTTTTTDPRSALSRARSEVSTAATSVSLTGDILSSQLHGGYAHPLARSWQTEHPLRKSQLIYPVFVTDDPEAATVISALPGQKRWGLNRLVDHLRPLVARGLRSVMLFGVPEAPHAKDPLGSAADDPAGPVIGAIHLLRRTLPDLLLCADVCLCEYTSHGHCGILAEDGSGRLDPALSVARIADVALAYATAGAHCVAPSDMNDGRVRAIKLSLTAAHLASHTLIMSYAAKFASSLYGPFRAAAGSQPAFGDRRCYQLPPGARGLARRAIRRDVAEGADIVMVKPALPYLDVVADARALAPDLPVAAYQVSGEFAMMHAAAAAGVVPLRALAFEATEGVLRAGASIVVSYFTPDFLKWLDEPPGVSGGSG